LLGDPWQRLFSLALKTHIRDAPAAVREFRLASGTVMQITDPAMSDQPDSLVRLGLAADAAMLDTWLQTLHPLPLLLARGRREMLEAILARPERHACFLIAAGTRPVAALMVTLVPHVAEGLTVATAGEWWIDPVAPNHGAYFAECVAALADWCRAHGIRQARLAPHMPSGSAIGPTREPDGWWRLDLTPTPKRLG
jgi:hypothetical protein